MAQVIKSNGFYQEGTGLQFTVNGIYNTIGGAAPSPTGSGAVTGNQITVAGNGTVTLPSPVGNGASIITKPTAAGSGTATLPQPTGNGSVTVGSTTVNGSGSVTVPAVPFGDGDVTLMQPSVLGAGSVTQPAPIGNGSIIFNPINASGSGSTTQPLPEPTKIVNVTVQGARINSVIEVKSDRPVRTIKAQGQPNKVIKVKRT